MIMCPVAYEGDWSTYHYSVKVQVTHVQKIVSFSDDQISTSVSWTLKNDKKDMNTVVMDETTEGAKTIETITTVGQMKFFTLL